MGMAAIHLCYTAPGTAQRAIDEFSAWTKKRVRAYEHTAAQEAPYSQLTLADAVAKWDAAHALMLQYVRDMWEAAEAGRGAHQPAVPRLRRDVAVRVLADAAAVAGRQRGVGAHGAGTRRRADEPGRNLMGLPGHTSPESRALRSGDEQSILRWRSYRR